MKSYFRWWEAHHKWIVSDMESANEKVSFYILLIASHHMTSFFDAMSEFKCCWQLTAFWWLIKGLTSINECWNNWLGMVLDAIKKFPNFVPLNQSCHLTYLLYYSISGSFNDEKSELHNVVGYAWICLLKTFNLSYRTLTLDPT